MLIGSDAFVAKGREQLIAAMGGMLVALDFACTIETADDPFFSTTRSPRTFSSTSPS